MADLAGIACVIVPVLVMSGIILLMFYSVGELRQMIDRWAGKR